MKILYVTTISNTVNAFLIPHIEMLINEGYDVDVAFNVEHEVKPEIYKMGCKIYSIPFQRSPLSKGNLRAYKNLRKLIVTEGYDLVHTHTPVASAIVRLVCKNLNSVRVFYTAHGFHFYKGAPFLNWLVYYPVEKYLAKYTDVIITINKEDFDRAKRKFKAKKIEYMPGVGIELEKIFDLKVDKKLKRKEIGVPKEAFVILSVGEINKNKNHEKMIRALANTHNPDIHYVICGEGVLKNRLLELAKKLKIQNRVHFLGFRNDVMDIYKTVDLFVFPSYREGLSVALMEAMASGLPCVVSNIRGNSDLIENEKGGFLVDPSDVNEFSNMISKYIENFHLLRTHGNFNKNKIKDFSISNVTNKIKENYIL